MKLEYSFILTEILLTEHKISTLPKKFIRIPAISLRGWAAGWHYLATDLPVSGLRVSGMPSQVAAYL